MTEQDMSYQNQPETTQSQERLTTMEENTTTTTPQDMEAQRERVMFEKYVQDGGEAIPTNFKSAGEWFDSLKEAQKNYTQGQQEISELKDQYNKEGVTNPNYQEPVAEAQPEATSPTGNEELRINIEEKTQDVPPVNTKITPELWSEWGNELAITGDLSSDTFKNIKEVTGYSDVIINEYISGQKAKMRESYTNASAVVGGQEKLNKIFQWAETALSTEEQANINVGLASSTYEVTLRGLESMFDKRPIGADKAQEPQMAANTAQVGATDTGFVGYKTKREFTADRNNPRFKLEPQYRQAVEQRMIRTDFNSLPA